VFPRCGEIDQNNREKTSKMSFGSRNYDDFARLADGGNRSSPWLTATFPEGYCYPGLEGEPVRVTVLRPGLSPAGPVVPGAGRLFSAASRAPMPFRPGGRSGRSGENRAAGLPAAGARTASAAGTDW